MSPASQPLRIAVFGCGVVGGGMARRLLGMANHVVVYDFRAEVVMAFARTG